MGYLSVGNLPYYECTSVAQVLPDLQELEVRCLVLLRQPIFLSVFTFSLPWSRAEKQTDLAMQVHYFNSSKPLFHPERDWLLKVGLMRLGRLLSSSPPLGTTLVDLDTIFHLLRKRFGFKIL